MDNDVDLLIAVRALRERMALETMLAERRAADERRAIAQRATDRLRQQEEASALHSQATRRSAAKGKTNVGQMLQASAWSRELDARVTREEGEAARADALAHEQEQVLEASRDKLRRAAGAVVKADEMRQRERAVEGRMRDSRDELAAEEAASAAWAARRS